jgi:hypothetical protein
VVGGSGSMRFINIVLEFHLFGNQGVEEVVTWIREFQTPNS